jgi:hypothetical protein
MVLRIRSIDLIAPEIATYERHTGRIETKPEA